jgi:hypothetical protein
MRTIESLKRRAKEIRKASPGMLHGQALEQAAKEAGFRSYGAFRSAAGDKPMKAKP